MFQANKNILLLYSTYVSGQGADNCLASQEIIKNTLIV